MKEDIEERAWGTRQWNLHLETNVDYLYTFFSCSVSSIRNVAILSLFVHIENQERNFHVHVLFMKCVISDHNISSAVRLPKFSWSLFYQKIIESQVILAIGTSPSNCKCLVEFLVEVLDLHFKFKALPLEREVMHMIDSIQHDSINLSIYQKWKETFSTLRWKESNRD